MIHVGQDHLPQCNGSRRKLDEQVRTCFYQNYHKFEHTKTTFVHPFTLIFVLYSHFLRSPSNNPLPKCILSICEDNSLFPLNLDWQYGQFTFTFEGVADTSSSTKSIFRMGMLPTSDINVTIPTTFPLSMTKRRLSPFLRIIMIASIHCVSFSILTSGELIILPKLTLNVPFACATTRYKISLSVTIPLIASE